LSRSVPRKPLETLQPERRQPLPVSNAMEQTAKAFCPKRALAGKSEDQLLQALQDYKSGKRANAVMKGMAAGLSDQDMATLAAHFASLK